MSDMNTLNFRSPGEVRQAQYNLRGETNFIMTMECKKCGGFHSDLEFRKLKDEVEVEGITYTHEGMCPDTNLQILLAWRKPEDVVERETGVYMQALGKALKTENIDPAIIEKLMATMGEAVQDDDK